MKYDSLDDALRAYYSPEQMPADKAELLAELARRVSPVAVTAAPRRAFGSLAACFVAGCLLTGGGYALYERSATRPDAPVADVPLRTVSAGLDLQTVSSAISFPRLFVVRMYHEKCPKCPTVNPIYANLISRYSGEPLVFVTLDFSDKKRTAQTRLLADSLGLEWLVKKQLPISTIHVVDRETKTVISSVSCLEELPSLETSLAQHLPGRRH